MGGIFLNEEKERYDRGQRGNPPPSLKGSAQIQTGRAPSFVFSPYPWRAATQVKNHTPYNLWLLCGQHQHFILDLTNLALEAIFLRWSNFIESAILDLPESRFCIEQNSYADSTLFRGKSCRRLMQRKQTAIHKKRPSGNPTWSLGFQQSILALHWRLSAPHAFYLMTIFK